MQGVGFRPFVHRLATELALVGHVGNDTDGVFVEVEGPADAVEDFERRLRRDAPPLARVDAVEASVMDVVGQTGFRIVESRASSAVRTFVAPDAAVCDDCLRELFDPADRRYRYPFITCTNCGPRFTITKRLPYDRPNTTMAGFPLCDACAAQYHDPGDRRFHAQPLACAQCGPRVWFEAPDGRVDATDEAIAAAQRALGGGQIVAVKGLGGYHLACAARSDAAVELLRRRKGRAAKPFAVMAGSLPVAAELGQVDDSEARLLTGPQRPILLLDIRPGGPLSPLVAPENPQIGVMLPYTPLHHLLFSRVPGSEAPVPDVLVMTSGNLTDEPICYEDGDARRRLSRLVDGWLIHDRPIHVPCDDSVVRIVDGDELPVRRSRGYAPLPVTLPMRVPSVLAVGGELKNTFCLATGDDAWMSQHIGDMGSVETLAAFERSTEQFRTMYQIEPEYTAADMHPAYQTRRWAEAFGPGSLVLVQHHHAHIAAVMAEHGVPFGERILGFAFDGTGYGPDGAIWGGEVLLAGYDEFDRRAHLRYVPLPGGDSAIRKPYRAALAHLWAAGLDWSEALAPVRAAGPEQLAVLERQLQRGVQCVATSSMGRLFDAVSSLLDVRHEVSYEAQAAIELETQALAHLDLARTYRFIRIGDQIDPGPVLRAIVADLNHGIPSGPVAAGFHVAVAGLMGELADEIGPPAGVRRVALSGGVFQNVLLSRLARRELERRGFEVLTHRIVPPNDGGLALGQVLVAASQVTRPPIGQPQVGTVAEDG